jgi:hypothetical protein
MLLQEGSIGFSAERSCSVLPEKEGLPDSIDCTAMEQPQIVGYQRPSLSGMQQRPDATCLLLFSMRKLFLRIISRDMITESLNHSQEEANKTVYGQVIK